MFASWPGVETASAGLAPDAEEECSAELVEWADIIFIMERAHRAKLRRRFRAYLKCARVICLDIPDDYAFMQRELVALLEKEVRPHLCPSAARGKGSTIAASFVASICWELAPNTRQQIHQLSDTSA